MALSNKYEIHIVHCKPTFKVQMYEAHPIEDNTSFPAGQCICLSVEIVNDIYRTVLRYEDFDILTSTII